MTRRERERHRTIFAKWIATAYLGNRGAAYFGITRRSAERGAAKRVAKLVEDERKSAASQRTRKI